MKPSVLMVTTLAALVAVLPAIALNLSPAPITAQDQAGPQLPPVLETQEGDDLEQQMRELFAAVERDLRLVDDLLFEAAAGENDLFAPEVDLDQLLRDTEQRSLKVTEGITEILELAGQMESQNQQQQQQSSQQGQSSEGEGGQSPLDGRPQNQRQGQMPTPDSNDAGTELPDGQQPGPNESAPKNGDDPQDGSKPEESGQQSEGGDPRSGASGAPSAADAAGRWGDLPPRVQTIFRNQISDDMPVQYRDWIDGYYRRLNRNH